MEMVGRGASARRAGRSGGFGRRVPTRLVWAGSVVAIVAAVKFCSWWASPEHRIEQFVASAQRGDAAGMLSLMDAKEVEHLNLTPQKLEEMIADAAGSPGGVAIKELSWEPLNEKQSLYNRWGRLTLTAKDGRPLTGARGGPLKLIVEAYNTDAGWKIGGSNFLVSVLAERTGYAFRRGYYAALCARHAVPAEVFSPERASWEMAPAAP